VSWRLCALVTPRWTFEPGSKRFVWWYAGCVIGWALLAIPFVQLSVATDPQLIWWVLAVGLLGPLAAMLVFGFGHGWYRMGAGHPVLRVDGEGSATSPDADTAAGLVRLRLRGVPRDAARTDAERPDWWDATLGQHDLLGARIVATGMGGFGWFVALDLPDETANELIERTGLTSVADRNRRIAGSPVAFPAGTMTSWRGRRRRLRRLVAEVNRVGAATG
jgi:hypothetical protein